MKIRRTLAAFLIGDASFIDIAKLLAEVLELDRQQAPPVIVDAGLGSDG